MHPGNLTVEIRKQKASRTKRGTKTNHKLGVTFEGNSVTLIEN